MKSSVVFLIILLLCPIYTALGSQFAEITDYPNTTFDQVARIDAAMSLMYDSFIQRNQSYIYGGRGKNSFGQEIYVDYHGDLWTMGMRDAYLPNGNNDYARWTRLPTDKFKLRDLDNPLLSQDEEYPPLPRFGHSSIICPTLDGSIMHNSNTPTKKETNLNYIMFGGKRQQVRTAENLVIQGNCLVTDELYVFSEYAINTGERKETRYHWYRIEPETGADWPSARMYAQIVPLFNEQDPVNARNKFLLFGGLDANNHICTDAYIATFSRDMLVASPSDNEWNFDMGLDVVFELVTLDTAAQETISVYGASAIYDPYFYHPSGADPTPRVVVIGGIRGSSNPEESDNVDVLCTAQGYWNNIEGDSILLNDMGTSHKRAHFSAVLNYRTHEIQVVGGEFNYANLDETGSLDIQSPGNNWVWESSASSGMPAVSHHSSCYSMGTAVYCVANWNTVPERRFYIDRAEKDISQTWEIKKSALYGLNNPESVANTRRLASDDIIKIYQENDYSGKVNDCYRCSLVIPVWCNRITIEGVVYNGVKPILYQLYGTDTLDLSWYLEGLDDGKFAREMTDVVYSHPALKLKNLKICHFVSDPQSPQTNIPTDIPQNRLEEYTDYPDVPRADWNFANHHVDDPGMFMHTESIVENCDFALNGVGVVMICVSSAINPAEIKGCTFENNFTGLIALEKDHLIHYSTFKNNYLTGAGIDKGAHSTFRENLFVGNGRLGHMISPDYGLGDYCSAILSDFATTVRVPLIQTPFIHNNTFVSNYRTITISDHGYKRQYMNRLIFFNNIIDNTVEARSPVFIKDSDERGDMICMNNCFNLQSGIDIVATDDPVPFGHILSCTLEDDPDLQSPDYTLGLNSPCIDHGLYLLEPGISSALGYPDYRRLDIGFHYSLYTGNVPLVPENLSSHLSSAGPYVIWDPPSSGDPDGYLVLVESEFGLEVSEYVSASQHSFTYNGDETNLWFGVMSHNNQQIYSDCVWVEWIGE